MWTKLQSCYYPAVAAVCSFGQDVNIAWYHMVLNGYFTYIKSKGIVLQYSKDGGEREKDELVFEFETQAFFPAAKYFHGKPYLYCKYCDNKYYVFLLPLPIFSPVLTFHPSTSMHVKPG